MVRGRWVELKSFTRYVQQHEAALTQLKIDHATAELSRVVASNPPACMWYALNRAAMFASASARDHRIQCDFDQSEVNSAIFNWSFVFTD